MKRTEPKLFSEIFNDAMARVGAADAMAQHRACYMWPEIVGPGVNRYTFRRYVENGVLHVYISSASLKNELSFMRQSLLERLNDAVGSNAISEIVFH